LALDLLCRPPSIALAIVDIRKENQMAGNIDKAKGRIKEAAGALTDDPALKREGKLDQLAGDVKDGVEKAVDAVKNAVTGKKGVPR
jgi:uncharacterized protein YjbJ (UPF0337 family)